MTGDMLVLLPNQTILPAFFQIGAKRICRLSIGKTRYIDAVENTFVAKVNTQNERVTASQKIIIAFSANYYTRHGPMRESARRPIAP